LARVTGRLDWSLDAATIARRVRSYHPWPGSFTRVREGDSCRRLKIFPPVTVCDEPLCAREVRAAGDALVIGCGSGALWIGEVQPEGSRRMAAADYLSGHRPDGVE